MEQKPSGENNLSWREAIIEVLKTSNKPMSSVEIVAAIKERGIREVTGNTPEATVGAQIYSSIIKEGENSPFTKIDSNEFGLKQQNETPKLTDPIGSAAPEEDSETPKKSNGIIRAFGMFWRRDSVNWKSNPKLLGMREKVAADFCNQQGIYLLHDRNEVIYVGRTLERPLGQRLFEHTIDRLNGRWDRFSWFGYYKVSPDGILIQQNLKEMNSNAYDNIVTMEAVLIEALETRQNRKGGDGGFSSAEYSQQEDQGIIDKKKKELWEEFMAHK
jgi:hypothetical protein